MNPAPNTAYSFPARLLGVFLLFAATLSGLGYFFIRESADRLEQKGFSNLQAVAELKVKLVSLWREDLLEDGEMFFSNPFLAEYFHQTIDSGPNPATERVGKWFESIRKRHEYRGLYLLDREGHVHVSVEGDRADGENLHGHVFDLAREAMEWNRVHISDFHRTSHEDVVNMHLVYPIREPGATGETVIGACVASVDPSAFLYPLLETWPSESASGETSIVRRDGTEAVILTPLRHVKDPPLTIRLPLDDPEYPAVQAIRGGRGLVQGTDYRKEPVIAYIREIPDTGWFLVAKMDRAEFYGPIRRQVLTLVLVACLLVGLVGVAVLALWRHERTKDYKALYRAEMERLALVEHLAHVTRHANDSIFLVDRHLNYLEANDRAIQTYGYSREELLGMNVSDLRSPTHPLNLAEIESQLDQEGGAVFETVHRRKDGSVFPVEVSTRSMWIEGEKFYQGIIRDITERRKMEENLRRLATAIEQLDETVMITDPDGVIQFVNPAFEKATGYTAQEVLGSRPSMVKSGQHDPGFYATLWETIKSGRTWSGRIVNRRKDGALYTEESIISPVIGTDGEIVNFVAVKRDISARIAMERQIRHMQKMEAVGQLAGGIAHDFNNLLQVVLAYAEFTRQAFAEGSREHQDLGLVLSAGKRGADLTRQLLAFSRQSELFIRPFDIQPLVKEACKMLNRTIPASIVLSHRFAPELPKVVADPGQVHQILINLCVNAKDAMPHGGVLSISVYPAHVTEDDCRNDLDTVPGLFVVLEIADTGSGISPDHLSHIFDPFFTTKEPGKGTGLGLASVYGIVRQHGGFIACESELGKGSLFRVYLPAGEKSASEGSWEEPTEGLRGGTECLLLAEDDEAIRSVARRGLEGLGYQVLTAHNGLEAKKLLIRFGKEIDLAVFDIQMPEMDGELCLEEMRRMGIDIPVIVASGFIDPDLRERLFALKVRQAIFKPYSVSELAGAIRSALDSRAPAPPA